MDSNSEVFTIPCNTCGGDKVVIVGWDEEAYENIEGPCPQCNGTGEVNVVQVQPDWGAVAVVAFVKTPYSPGDKVRTANGFIGTVLSITRNSVVIYERMRDGHSEITVDSDDPTTVYVRFGDDHVRRFSLNQLTICDDDDAGVK